MSENTEAPEAIAFNARRDLYIAAGFAPGRYFCRCAHCHETFNGDKRASACFPCATALINANFVEPAKVESLALEGASRSIGVLMTENARLSAEVERVAIENAALRAALQPFAKAASDAEAWGDWRDGWIASAVSFEDCEAAREALNPSQQKTDL